MAGKRRLQIDIIGDAKGLAAAFASTDSHLGKLSRSIGGIAKSAALGFAGVAGAAVIAGPKILELGTQLDTIANKSTTVFGNSLGEVESWADGVAGSMGLTSDQAVGLATSMGDLLIPMGFTRDQAADMSTEMLDLSGALSAWSGGTLSAAEVSDTLAKAMLGERDGLKALGISISEADVQRQLAIMGAKDLTGAELEQAKALATQQLIFDKSADAQAAWADGTMDGIKAQNEATASIEEVKEGLVKALFPALQAVVPYVGMAAQWLGEHMPAAMETAQRFITEQLVPAFNEHLLPVIEAVVGWVRDNWPQISEVIGDVITTAQQVIQDFVDLVTALWQQFGDDILGFVKDIWPEIQQVFQGAFDVIMGIVGAFTALFEGDWSALWASIQQILSGAWAIITGLFSGAIDAVQGILGAGWGLLTDLTGDFVSGIVDAIAGIPGQLLGLVGSFMSAAGSLGTAVLDGLRNALSATAGFAGDVGAAVVAAVKSVINSQVISRINSALEFTIPVPFGPDININPPDIPMLARGGVADGLAIVGERGPELAVFGRAGRVLSHADSMRAVAGSTGGGAQVINIHIDGRQIAQAVADTSQRMGGLPFAVSAS